MERMKKYFKLNFPMNCAECKKEIIRKSGNQKFCVPCSNELNRLKNIKKYADRKLNDAQT